MNINYLVYKVTQFPGEVVWEFIESFDNVEDAIEFCKGDGRYSRLQILVEWYEPKVECGI